MSPYLWSRVSTSALSPDQPLDERAHLAQRAGVAANLVERGQRLAVVERRDVLAVGARAGLIEDIEHALDILGADLLLAVQLRQVFALAGAAQRVDDRQAELPAIQVGRGRLAG